MPTVDEFAQNEAVEPKLHCLVAQHMLPWWHGTVMMAWNLCVDMAAQGWPRSIVMAWHCHNCRTPTQWHITTMMAQNPCDGTAPQWWHGISVMAQNSHDGTALQWWHVLFSVRWTPSAHTGRVWAWLWHITAECADQQALDEHNSYYLQWQK